jgi:hypothetical protein
MIIWTRSLSEFNAYNDRPARRQAISSALLLIDENEWGCEKILL